MLKTREMLIMLIMLIVGNYGRDPPPDLRERKIINIIDISLVLGTFREK